VYMDFRSMSLRNMYPVYQNFVESSFFMAVVMLQSYEAIYRNGEL
jgi:hypothetical protein